MTEQFREATARFSAEVEAAMTRARRATSEARARSTEFRRGTEDLTSRVKAGAPHGEAEPTSEKQRAEAAEFRVANGLPVVELPDAESRPAPARPVDDDEDFSQHQILNDIDDEAAAARDSVPDYTQSSDDYFDSSQQRIPLLDDSGAFRDDGLPTILEELAPPQDRS